MAHSYFFTVAFNCDEDGADTDEMERRIALAIDHYLVNEGITADEDPTMVDRSSVEVVFQTSFPEEGSDPMGDHHGRNE